MVNPWIRVSDRVPDGDDADVQIIVFRNPHVFAAYYITYDLSMEWVDFNGERIPEPTHWMRMPEPPTV